ncbi:lysozyme-like protein, partial [Basidiobolus meristosporus CBS 931.73]
ITNVFEYGTTTYDYETCVDLNDSRGYTCGLVGFTTGTGDVYTVVSKYLQMNPASELRSYYATLKDMADPRECGPEVDFKKLNGFPEAWRRTACTDAKFRRIQETVTNEMYFEPAMKLAESYKVFSPLGKSIFY